MPEIASRTGFSITCHGLAVLSYKKSRGVLFYWGVAEGGSLRRGEIWAVRSSSKGLCTRPRSARKGGEWSPRRVTKMARIWDAETFAKKGCVLRAVGRVSQSSLLLRCGLRTTLPFATGFRRRSRGIVADSARAIIMI